MGLRWTRWAAFLLAGLPAGAGFGAEAEMLDDANLRAVQFVDENEGWAVGDHGAIFHTLSKGAHWDGQPSGTDATLTSIQMQGDHIGWICGRQSKPYNPGTSGLLLGTGDGGLLWINVSQAGQFPGLNKLTFVDSRRGWALGDATDHSPMGVWITTDGANSWAPLRGNRQVSWGAAALFDFNNGVFGGGNRAVANLRAGSLRPANVDWLAGTTVCGAARSGSRTWLVGERSQIAFSDDAGVTWQKPAAPLPPEVRNACDFHAVAAVGEKIWVVGRPGSIVLHSPDNGQSWTLQKTGCGMPLFDVSFPTASAGWAVGAMGVILKTENGGETWAPSWDPKIGRRAAILYLLADARNAPLTAVARYGADQGYYNVAVGVASADLAVEPPHAFQRAGRQADAFRIAGGVLADSRRLFPLAPDCYDDPTSEILARWDRRLEGKAMAQLVRELAVAIRIYRPSVIVTEPTPAKEGEGGVRGLVARATAKAIEAAATPGVLPELDSTLALPPHRAAKIYALATDAVDDGRAAVITHSASDVGPRLGRPYADLANAALASAAEEFTACESSVAFKLVSSSLADADLGKDLTAGLSLRSGGDSRRIARPAVELTEAAVRQLEQRKNLLSIAEKGGGIVPPEQCLGSLKQATSGLTRVQACQVAFQFARKYVELGKWDLARSGFEYVVQTYPELPLSTEAFRWLIAFQTSGEARLRLGRTGVVVNVSAHTDKEGRGMALDNQIENVVRSSDEARRWSLRALEYANGLKYVSADMWGDVRIQFALAVAYRHLGSASNDGSAGNVKMLLDNIAAPDPASRWARVVAQERWMLRNDPKIKPPPVIVSSFTRSRPKLDGELEDDCWKGEDKLPLRSGEKDLDAAFASDVRIRHDNEFLYVAARCNYPGAEYAKPPLDKRTRDADVSQSDRIEILIDVDRDYQTYFRLQIDQQGRVADDCWGDKTWNPKIYVANGSDASGWRTEVAIPLLELMPDPSKRRNEVWAVNVQRVTPGKGTFAINHPASPAVRPEGFLLFTFSEAAAAAAQ